MKRHCIHCAEPFTGRSDKKFCCDHCRTLHNNSINKDETNQIRHINNLLRRNRRVLLALCNEKKDGLINREELIYKGFRFDYITHFHRDQEGNVLHFCYDIGYLPMQNKTYKLIQTKELTTI